MRDAPVDDAEPFEWVPPDLVPTDPWYKRILLLLIYTCSLYPVPGPLIEEGSLHLGAHRSNYNHSNPDPLTTFMVDVSTRTLGRLTGRKLDELYAPTKM
jgi:hypothetical protein